MPTLNDFALAPVQGLMDLQVPGTVIEVQVDTTVSTPLIPGQAVKQSVAVTTGLPKVVALTANTDKILGFVPYNSVFGTFAASKVTELAMDNSVMWMTAGAAIAAGASLEYVYTTNRVITSAGSNTKIGHALNGVAAAGDLVRVRIISPIV
ncbi:capsid cement protein [Dyadobacter psychrotolerans]|uniref:DUF2190 family protein n=1 Tax=Dyadobacter psychrotolerans TaxID=2541721 RepID=A0A4R5DV59_9BACT|nr:capsid cement protein [Dyadobacter psychrotolerans]TDE17707.1 hypothetical protein E0F88_07400 [Dyadobacter psychrotolerans]